MSAEEQDRQELSEAEHFVAETPAIEGVEGVRVEFGEDWAGYPSMWVIFKLRRDLDANDGWMDRFLQYSHGIQTKILHSGMKRFPYRRLERAA